MGDFRREAGGVGGTGRHHFAIAEDVVEREIAGDADDVFAGTVEGGEAEVGDAACERRERHRAGPDGQRGDTAFDVRHDAQELPNGLETRQGVLVS